jgi:hypothetical protein
MYFHLADNLRDGIIFFLSERYLHLYFYIHTCVRVKVKPYLFLEMIELHASCRDWSALHAAYPDIRCAACAQLGME